MTSLVKDSSWRRSFSRHCMTAVIILVVLLFGAIASADSVHPNVLILNSYSRELQWTDDQTIGIEDTYKEAYAQPVFHIEYLDWKNNPSEENLTLLRELFKTRYTGKKIDIVMTTDDAALNFALNSRDELFPGVPIVYSGVFPAAAASLTVGHENVTGVNEILDIAGTLGIARSFNPQISQLYLIYDNTESGSDTGELLKDGVTKAAPGIPAIHVNNLSVQEIIDMLRAAPDNSAVLMGTYTSDINGKTMELERYVRLFAENSRVPVYIFYDFEMGVGAVGGSLVSGILQGKRAAELGVQILKGQPADNLGPVNTLTSVKTLDYKAMQRYSLPTDRLSSDSVLINYPYSFYEQNKKLVWAAAAIFLLMAVYIIVLMVNIRRRKAAERNLRRSNEELTALYEEVAASQEELQAQYEQLEAMQAALGESEERYKLSVDGANDGVWDWDLHANQVYLSQRCREILDLGNKQLAGLKELLAEITSSSELARVTAALEDHLAGKTPYFYCEHRIDSKDGAKWLLARGKALVIAGQPVRMAGSVTDVTERKLNEERIHFLAFHDSLTGLWNRAALNEKLDNILKQRRDCSMGAVLFVDIDNFKDINDAFGHSYGDKLLVAIARMFEKKVGNRGIVARMGGDEFVIVLQDMGGKEELKEFMEKIEEIFINPITIQDRNFHVGISVGVSEFPDHGTTREELLRRADLAMYEAKKHSLNQIVVFAFSMETTIKERMNLEKQLREAVANDEFRLWYQPVLKADTGKVIGFEALARWYIQENDIRFPKDFISLAEETGLIIPIGQVLLRNACCMLSTLHASGYDTLGVTVNISVMQLVQPDFVEQVRRVIEMTGVPANFLGFEITESVLMESNQVNLDKLRELKEMGISIYLDDFGTGYSSLRYLDSMPIDVLKIDKSFVDFLGDVREGKQLAKLIIGLAHQMGIQTVAEGVETQVQLDKLMLYGCDAVQGYLFSRPMAEELVMDFLRSAAGENSAF